MLHTVRRVPPPRYTDEAWAIVDALLDVLPLAVDELRLTFRAAGAIDFVQGTLATLTALGDADAPSDLLLKLDFQIQHLLIDEFQDTSFTQVELIRRLTAGWQPDDGRTLFAVGDPMQSIYRFRGAEVGSSSTAQRGFRIADWPVEISCCAAISVRIRVSSSGSTQFSARAGRDERRLARHGRVRACDGRRRLRVGSAITAEIFVDDESEALAIVDHVQEALRRRKASRSRSRALASSPRCTRRSAPGIAFAAVELDALAERQSILDLVSLTHALLNQTMGSPGSRCCARPGAASRLPISSPYPRRATHRAEAALPGVLDAGTAIARSVGGRTRVFSRVAASAVRRARRARPRLRARIRGAWLALGGPGRCRRTDRYRRRRALFALLADHDVAGDLPDWPAFVDALGSCVRRRTAPTTRVSR